MNDLMSTVGRNADGHDGGETENISPSVISQTMQHIVIDMDKTKNLFEPVRKGTQQIEQAADKVQDLCSIKRSGLRDEQRRAASEVNQLTSSTSAKIKSVKKMLETIKDDLDTQTSIGGDNTESLTQRNLLNSSLRKFQNSIIRFQTATTAFKTDVQEDFERQAKIVNPNISQEQMQIMLEAEDPHKMLDRLLLNVSDDMLEEVNELQDRYDRVRQIEKQIGEIREMFDACAILVSEAQEHLNLIENNVERTRIQANQGAKTVQDAEAYVRRTRKTKMKYYFLCLVIILLVIFFVLWQTGLLKDIFG